MKCFKCKKETGRLDGGTILTGMVVEVGMDKLARWAKGDMEYFNTQLGKYSDGEGGCKVCICYECYIDGLFK